MLKLVDEVPWTQRPRGKLSPLPLSLGGSGYTLVDVYDNPMYLLFKIDFSSRFPGGYFSLQRFRLKGFNLLIYLKLSFALVVRNQ